MGQSKEIKQKWRGPKNIDNCFFVVFNCYDQGLISKRNTGHQALPPTNFETFLIFPSFLRSELLSSLATLAQSLLY